MGDVDFSTLGLIHPRECFIVLERIKKITSVEKKSFQLGSFVQYLGSHCGGLGLAPSAKASEWKTPEKFISALTDICIRCLEELPPEQLKGFVTPLAKAVALMVKAGISETHFAKMKSIAKSQIELAKKGKEAPVEAPRGKVPRKEDKEDSRKGLWQWQDSKKWETYSLEIQAKLQEAHKSGESFVKFAHGSTSYRVNLTKLQQENLSTTGVRQVRWLPDGEDGEEGADRGGGKSEGGRGGRGDSPRASRETEMKKGSLMTKWTDTRFLTETGAPDESVFEVEEEPDPFEGEEGVWQWQGDGGEWRDFSDFVQSLIERSRALKTTKVIFDRPAAYVTIEVFWREGFQRNTLNGQCRDVRLNASSSASSSSKKSSSSASSTSSSTTLAYSPPSPVSSPSLSPARSKSPFPDLLLEPSSKPSLRVSPRGSSSESGAYKSDYLGGAERTRALSRGEKLTMSARLGETGDKMEAAGRGKRILEVEDLTSSPPKRATRASSGTPSRTSSGGSSGGRGRGRESEAAVPIRASPRRIDGGRGDAFSILMRSASSGGK